MRPHHHLQTAHTDQSRLRRSRQATLILLTALLGATAAAQQPQPLRSGTIWRCGNLYSQIPCDNGRSLDETPALSPQKAREAQAQTDRIQRRADAMARERERLEDRATGQRPAVFEHPQPQHTGSALADNHLDKPRAPKRATVGGDFSARAAGEAPAGTKKKKKKKSDA